MLDRICSPLSAALFVASVMGAWSGAAAESEPHVPPQLRHFLAQPDHRNAVSDLMAEQWRHTFGVPCAAVTIEADTVSLSAPMQFDADDKPIQGMWREALDVKGCGVKQRFNVLMGVLKDGAIKSIALAPGTTKADLRLQRESLSYVKVAASDIIRQNCSNGHILDTRFVEFDATPSIDTQANAERSSKPRSWSEDWTYVGCGAAALVKIHYTDEIGRTQIMTKVSETRPIDVGSQERGSGLRCALFGPAC
jgi:hypothetical protein